MRAKWISLESEEAMERAEIERLLRKSYELVVAKLPRRMQERIAKGENKGERGKRRKHRRQ